MEKPYKATSGLCVLGGNLSPDFSAILKLAGVEGGLKDNLFHGKARVFESEQDLLDALDRTPDTFQNNDMIIVRYEGPSGAPGMPEMLDPTSRITTLCRERGIVVALMTDARFSGGSVGLVIGLVRSLGSAYIDEKWSEALIFAILIVILIFRPNGLLGARVREKV